MVSLGPRACGHGAPPSPRTHRSSLRRPCPPATSLCCATLQWLLAENTALEAVRTRPLSSIQGVAPDGTEVHLTIREASRGQRPGGMGLYGSGSPRGISGLIEGVKARVICLARVSDTRLGHGCAGAASVALGCSCGDRPVLHTWAPTPRAGGVRGQVPRHCLAVVCTPGHRPLTPVPERGLLVLWPLALHTRSSLRCSCWQAQAMSSRLL